MTMNFIRSTSLSSVQNFIQIQPELCEIIGTGLFTLSHPCDLKYRSRSHKRVPKCWVQWYLSACLCSNQITSKLSKYMSRFKFVNAVSKQQLFPLITSLSKAVSGCSDVPRFITSSNSIPYSWHVCEKIKLSVFALCWPCDPMSKSMKVVQHRASQWKWYKILEVNGACTVRMAGMT